MLLNVMKEDQTHVTKGFITRLETPEVYSELDTLDKIQCPTDTLNSHFFQTL